MKNIKRIQECCALLQDKNLKIAFIESASSGYLCSQFSIYKQSGAEILLGSLVTYDPSIKISILGVKAELINTYTAESQEVTDEMARLGHQYFKQADIIVACTGLLKSGGSESPTKPVGCFFISIYYAENIYQYPFFLEGQSIQKLDQLTSNVCLEVIHLIKQS